MSYVSLDQGTSSSRAIIYDSVGQAVAVAQSDIDLIFPQDGWVEQNPERFGSPLSQWDAEAIAESGLAPSDMATIGITNQRKPRCFGIGLPATVFTMPWFGKIVAVRNGAQPWRKKP